jgi:alpha-L-fucosidase
MKITALTQALTLASALVFGSDLVAQTAQNDFTKESQAERDARMAWFRDARFGMFIHWGVYSVPAGEWNGNKGYGEWFLEETKMPVSQYEQYAKQFNPTKFDAKAWVQTAKKAGMKYIVITSKHHDGFAMYRSELTDWGIKSTPFQRDPLKELAAACKDEGIVFCFYHSIMDWHHTDWGTRRAWNDKAAGTPDMDRYTAYMKGQLKELLTGYGPLGILWFDGEWESPWTHERGVNLYNYVRSLQPKIIVNNRVGKARSGMAGMDQGKERIGDYGTPEQEIPSTGFGAGVDWESCMTMNNHWGYNKNDQNWKSSRSLIYNLVDCASKGGNYLLNVGPTSEGLIPAPSVERLAEIGAWMQANGEAIYGSTASPFKKLAWGKATQKPGKLYLHVFDWPKDGILEVPIVNKIGKAYLLADRSRALEVMSKKTAKAAESALHIQLPASAPSEFASVVVVELDGAPKVIETTAAIKQTADGTLVLKAADAELVGQTIKLETKSGGAPNIGFWIDPNDSIQWNVQISQSGKYAVEVEFACAPGSEGSECVLIVDGKEYVGKVEATKGWEDFQVKQGGTIELEKTGLMPFLVKAKSKPGLGVVNLRSITFKPVQ